MFCYEHLIFQLFMKKKRILYSYEDFDGCLCMFIRCNLMHHQCNRDVKPMSSQSTTIYPMCEQCTTNVTNVDQLHCSSCQRLRVTTWELISCLCDSNGYIACIEIGNLYIRSFSPEESKIGRNMFK